MFPTLSRLAFTNIDIYRWILPDLSAGNSWLPTLWGREGREVACTRETSQTSNRIPGFEIPIGLFAGVAIIAGYILLRWNPVDVVGCISSDHLCFPIETLPFRSHRFRVACEIASG